MDNDACLSQIHVHDVCPVIVLSPITMPTLRQFFEIFENFYKTKIFVFPYLLSKKYAEKQPYESQKDEIPEHNIRNYSKDYRVILVSIFSK